LCADLKRRFTRGERFSRSRCTDFDDTRSITGRCKRFGYDPAVTAVVAGASKYDDAASRIRIMASLDEIRSAMTRTPHQLGRGSPRLNRLTLAG
jgi:hypothetical protein